MDTEENRLYEEENLQVAKDIRKELREMTIPVISVKMPEKIEATIVSEVKAHLLNEVKVNSQPFESLSKEFSEYLETAVKVIVAAIKESQPEAIQELSVSNINEAKTDKVSVTNLGTLEKRIEQLAKAVIDNQPIVNVEKQDITFPTRANAPISVRLSDGKTFYSANGGSGVFPAPNNNTDPLIGYQPADVDDSSTPKYYGFSNKHGAWYILRESSNTFRYAVGIPGKNGGGLYTDAWTDRANLTYDYFHSVF